MNQLRIIVIGMLLLELLPAGASPVYPVKVSGSNPRILVDQNDVPFLMVGDSPQSLMVNLSAANAAFYFANRATNGFNTVLMDAICTTYTYGPANASLLNGTLPFTKTLSGGSYDLTAPNEAYFAFLDQVINLAATNGIVVMLDPIETGGWLNTMLANGTANCRAYGQYLGNRYKNFPNIIWCSGNDFQDWSTPANDTVVLAVASGIRDRDTNHLQTSELGYFLSSSLDDPNWAPLIGLNGAYTYAPTYAEVLHAYNQSSAIPTFMVEANYEFEDNSGTDGGSTRNLRMQEYWTMLSGASGQIYGNLYSVRFSSGWQSQLDTPGVVQLGYMKNLFGSRAWYNLVPDQTHAFVTGGYGSFMNGVSGNGSGVGNNFLFTGNNYVTAALTPDGSLGMAYLPQGGTITVAMTKLQNGITARWFDPSANTFKAIAGSPFSNTGTQNFTPPGNNSAGNPDWVLVLETVANPLQIATGSLPSATMGVTYSCQIQAFGGSPPYSWSLTSSSPPIPPDLSFSANGVLSGLPTITGVFTLMVQVLDSTNAWATKNFAILITTPDTTTPSAPSGLTATVVNSSQINLSWTASTDTVGVTGYLLQRSQGVGSTNFTQLAAPTGTSYSDTSLTAGTTCNYQVQATDAAGNLSGYSSVVSATTPSAPSGLVAAYGFNEGTGTTVTDASGNGNNGTISSAAWTTSGKYGNALGFNGTSALVTINNATTLQLSTAMTLEAWVNPSTVSSAWRDVIFKANDNYYLEGTSTASGRPATGGTFASSPLYGTTALAVNSWTHLAATYDGTTTRLYVNGTQVSSQAQTGAMASSTNPLQIGGDSFYGQFFQGTIDEVRIYNVALTAAQVQTDMNTPISATSGTQAPTVPTNLVASAVSSSQINLSWTASTDNVGVTGYLVQRSQGAGSTNFVQMATPTGTNYSDTSLTAATTYNYQVQATDAAGNLSGYSSVASVTTLVSDTTTPSAPSGLTATAVNSSQINLSWTASTDTVGVTGYLLQRSQGVGSTNFTQLAAPTGTSYSDTSLTAGTTCNYQVQATDAAGNLSGYSSVVSATTPSAPSGLVAAYGFNEGTGTTVTDASGNGNNGTISSAAWTTSGKYGNALGFNGTSALVTINNATTLQLSTAMTLEAWVNPSTVSSAWRDVIFKANDNYYLEGTSTASGRPATGGTFASSPLYGTTALAVNSWTHLAATYDGTTTRLYVNGTQVSSQAQTGAMASSTNPLQIGGDSFYGQFFQGTIDEVRIYNVALTAAQVQTDMNTPISAVGATNDTQPPTAPANLTASAVSSSQINLSWTASTDNVGVTGYLMQRSQGIGSTSFVQVATPTGANYSDTGLSSRTRYNYRVQATDAAGNLSGYSSVTSVTTTR